MLSPHSYETLSREILILAANSEEEAQQIDVNASFFFGSPHHSKQLKKKDENGALFSDTALSVLLLQKANKQHFNARKQ